MTWEEFKKKAEKLGYYDCDDFVKIYIYKKGISVEFYENGDIEIDGFVILVDIEYDRMLLIMKALNYKESK